MITAKMIVGYIVKLLHNGELSMLSGVEDGY
jgi:hypothetical protein